MAVRRIAENQPESFAFDAANLAWAHEQIAKYPAGKQASAVIPLLWRAQEQHNGWLPEPAMRYIGEMLDMPYIRVLEVATFYTMFQLKPVGSVAHIQVCGTTPCLLRGSEELIKICKNRIAAHPHDVTADGRFSWEEVECLGACVNAPMVQIFKDTFEDLTPESFEKMLDDMVAGRPVSPGPQTDRHLSVNADGRTQLFEGEQEYGPLANPFIAPYVMSGNAAMIASDARDFGAAPDDAKNTSKNASANGKKETAGKVTKSEKVTKADKKSTAESEKAGSQSEFVQAHLLDPPSADELKKEEAAVLATLAALPKGASAEDKANAVGKKPLGLAAARESGADDLKRIKGVGPVIEGKLNEQGIWHFDQIAQWQRPEILWFDTFLSFKGRIDRDTWIEQASLLAKGGETEFSRRVDKGEVASSASRTAKTTPLKTTPPKTTKGK